MYGREGRLILENKEVVFGIKVDLVPGDISLNPNHCDFH
jgi:hypothetical protein